MKGNIACWKSEHQAIGIRHTRTVRDNHFDDVGDLDNKKNDLPLIEGNKVTLN